MPIKVEQDSVVLVMDPGSGDVRLITPTLEKAGFEVLTSSDEPSILNLCRTSDHSVRLVIMDTSTPGIHVSELLEELREINPGIRVLLMADQSESDAVRERVKASNVSGHLKRPFRRAQLLGSVLDVTAEPLVRTA